MFQAYIRHDLEKQANQNLDDFLVERGFFNDLTMKWYACGGQMRGFLSVLR